MTNHQYQAWNKEYYSVSYTHLKDNKVITLCSEFSNLEEMNHQSLKTNYQNLTHRKQVIFINLEPVNKLQL